MPPKKIKKLNLKNELTEYYNYSSKKYLQERTLFLKYKPFLEELELSIGLTA